MTIRICKTTGPEDNGLYVMSRAKKASGAMVQQADVASIAYRVMDADDTAATAATGSLTVSSVIYDTLQTTALDSRWPSNAPAAGYNFGAAIPGTAFPDPSTRYFVRVNATMTDGATLTLYQGFHTTDEAY